jgi:hypothetical protein
MLSLLRRAPKAGRDRWPANGLLQERMGRVNEAAAAQSGCSTPLWREGITHTQRHGPLLAVLLAHWRCTFAFGFVPSRSAAALFLFRSALEPVYSTNLRDPSRSAPSPAPDRTQSKHLICSVKPTRSTPSREAQEGSSLRIGMRCWWWQRWWCYCRTGLAVAPSSPTPFVLPRGTPRQCISAAGDHQVPVVQAQHPLRQLTRVRGLPVRPPSLLVYTSPAA